MYAGREGFFHYRQYSAVDLASKRSFEDVWRLVLDGSLPEDSRPEDSQAERSSPDVTDSDDFSQVVRGLRQIPPDSLTPARPGETGSVLDVLRTSVSLLGSELGFEPTHDIDAQTLRAQALQLGSVVPTILAATNRLRHGREPIAPRSDLGHAANYLWMLNGSEPSEEHSRAIEQYMILTVDHGFNASTFAARVIVSTGADLAAAECGAIGALSGPLHGGAPSRALDMLDEIATPDRAEQWLRGAIGRGDRIMGFGHRVYRTEDPRSAFLRDVAAKLGGPLFDLAVKTERTAVDLLAELKPERELCTNVEFYAGVVMDACSISREMFTPTFAAARTIGWTAHVLEQAADNRLIRPAARYVGPIAPQPVPIAS